jgi:hypothetical protein
MKRGVYPIFLDGELGNGASSVGSDVIENILSKL